MRSALVATTTKFRLACRNQSSNCKVELLRRNRDIHQRQAQHQRLALLQVRIDELRPLRRDFLGHARIAVAGKIGEDEVGIRLARTAHLEEVDGLGATGRVAGLGDLGADQRVDQTRLAHIGAAQEGDLWRARRQETASGQPRPSQSASAPSCDHYGLLRAAQIEKEHRACEL